MGELLLSLVLISQGVILVVLWLNRNRCETVDLNRIAQALTAQAISSFGTDTIPRNELDIYVKVNYYEICSATGISDRHLPDIQDLTAGLVTTILESGDETMAQENFIYG